MELQLSMLKEYDNSTISMLTGIKEKTIRDWRAMMEYVSISVDAESAQFYSRNPERRLQLAFVSTLSEPYKEFVKTPFGVIDVLTKTTIYEIKIKLTNSIVHKAVGQIMLYSAGMNNIKKVIVASKIHLSQEMRHEISKMGIVVIEFDL
jgi:hypothetical protein